MSYRLFTSDQGHRTLIAWVFLITGLILVFYANSFLIVTVRILAGLLLLFGLLQLFYAARRPETATESRIYAFAGIAGGIVLMIWPQLLVGIFPLASGIVLLIGSVYQIWKSFALKSMGISLWTGSLITGLLILAGSIYLLFNPFQVAALVFRVAGILLAFEGAMILWQQSQFD